MRWQKGQSGNPGGRPKALADVQAAAREHTVEALATLVEIMKDPKQPAVTRLSAADKILERGWGRPRQYVGLPNFDLECFG